MRGGVAEGKRSRTHLVVFVPGIQFYHFAVEPRKWSVFPAQVRSPHNQQHPLSVACMLARADSEIPPRELPVGRIFFFQQKISC